MGKERGRQWDEGGRSEREKGLLGNEVPREEEEEEEAMAYGDGWCGLDVNIFALGGGTGSRFYLCMSCNVETMFTALHASNIFIIY